MDVNSKEWKNLQRFANKHRVVLQDNGTVGFGRPCVGFTHGENYIDYCPISSGPTFERVPGFQDDRLYPGEEAPDAYHKHDCLCVLVHDDNFDTALLQLNAWITRLEKEGELEIAEYNTGATGMQAMFSGVIGHAIRFKKGDKNETRS